MGEIRCGKRRILSAFALHKNSAFEIHTTSSIIGVALRAEVLYNPQRMGKLRRFDIYKNT